MPPLGITTDTCPHHTYGEAASRPSPVSREALNKLKDYLGMDQCAEQSILTDAYLMRCLDAAQSNIPKAVQVMKQRRVFEQSLPSIRVTPPVLTMLRSGAISTFGPDVGGRVVLSLCMKDMKKDPLDEQDVQRLVTILMEYVLGCCIQEPRYQSFVHTNESTSVDATEVQQVTVLINDEGCSWHSSNMVLSNIRVSLTLLSSYYPRLVGQVLLYQPSCDAKLLVKHVLPGGSLIADAVASLEVVTPAHVQRYISPTVLPDVLGGTNRSVDSSCAFADAVLRHWFLETSYLITEEASARPIWKLPPCTASAGAWSVLQRRVSDATVANCMAMSRTCSERCEEAIGCHLLQHPGELCGLTLASHVDHYAPRTHSLSSLDCARTCYTASEGEYAEDGINSYLSDLQFRPCSEEEMSPTDMCVHMEDEREVLIKELQKERQRRLSVEQRLLQDQAHTAAMDQLDSEVANKMKEALRAGHGALNILVKDVVMCANEAAACGYPPTLFQLLSLTFSAIEKATNRVGSTTTMKSSKPIDQKQGICACCAIM
uniref:WGS project CAEQ00000000 data, annotated contig 1151 n=1 Tax=Trypanosoma congolense (strain IL3000) TaxID=1068625 RepID=F9W465_TRYCI|nr:unnamed protein product [Trypanosoma congolense IL3000]